MLRGITESVIRYATEKVEEKIFADTAKLVSESGSTYTIETVTGEKARRISIDNFNRQIEKIAQETLPKDGPSKQ